MTLSSAYVFPIKLTVDLWEVSSYMLPFNNTPCHYVSPLTFKVTAAKPIITLLQNIY